VVLKYFVDELGACIMKTCPICQSINASEVLLCQSCGAGLDESDALRESFDALPPGTALYNGALILDTVLGQGGFGITYRGTETATGKLYAVKEFFPYGCLRRGNKVTPSHVLPPAEFVAARENFIREVNTTLRCRHPNIVEVRTLFEENNTAYFVMEYLDGQTLHAVLEKRGAVPEREALFYIEQIGGALETLHAANLLHRDIKPENIMICGLHQSTLRWNTTPPRVVLLDFGSAREFVGGSTKQMTSVLTPGYAPLEQYGQRARFGRFTDIYALGATLYHLLTGQAPPQATDRAAGYALTPPEQLNPHVSHLVSQAVMWAMEMRVDERPQTLQDWFKSFYGKRQTATPEPISVDKGATQDKTASQVLLTAPDETAAAGKTAALSDSVPHESAEPVGRNAMRPRKGDMSSEQWYQVDIHAKRVKWPKQCACCNAPCTTFYIMETRTAAWEVPYCAACREHAERGQSIEGMLHGLAAASFGFGAIGASVLGSNGAGSTFGVLLPCAMLILPCALLIGNELFAKFWLRREQKQNSDCCELRPAMHYKGRSGDEFHWEFRNRAFAEEFCRINSEVEVKAPQPAAKTVANSQPAATKDNRPKITI
jgi:serine/threonine protein kinase